MSDVRVIIQRDSEREERTVTTGTTAADLFAGERSIIAARVAGELKDLSYELEDGETVVFFGGEMYHLDCAPGARLWPPRPREPRF